MRSLQDEHKYHFVRLENILCGNQAMNVQLKPMIWVNVLTALQSMTSDGVRC